MTHAHTAVSSHIETLTNSATVPPPIILEMLYAAETELAHTAVLRQAVIAAERFLNAPPPEQRQRRTALKTAVREARPRGLLP
ncbi:MAG: hypothetical protein GY803_23230 [Chloroflexi bacterium]|nr:hypothetical protein [Chloroflexota bacterium]